MRLAELGPRASYVRAIVVAALLVGALIALRLAGDAPAPRREAAVTDPPALRDPAGPSAASALPRHALGTADPIELIASARNGRWVVACQARGGPMRPYVIRGEGAGQPIDGFVTSSPDDRWIAVLRDGKLVLIDDADGTEHIVPEADILDPGVAPRFGGDSRHLLYFRIVDGARIPVIRDLSAQRDRLIALPRASVRHVRWKPGVAWARLELERPPLINTRRSWPEGAEQVRSTTCEDRAISPPPPPRGWIAPAWLNLDTGELRTKRSPLGRHDAAVFDRWFVEESFTDGPWTLTTKHGRYVITDRATGTTSHLPPVIRPDRTLTITVPPW